MSAYVVSYKERHDDKFGMVNLVWADDYGNVQREFDGCDWFAAHVANESEIRECRAKGMPERWLMGKTRTDAMEIAVAMADMWHELNPDSESGVSGVRHNLYHSIIGDAQYPYEGYASEMIGWLERNIKMKQYRQFKAVQNGLVAFGVIPGPRKEQ